jgi:hypothetical protein
MTAFLLVGVAMFLLISKPTPQAVVRVTDQGHFDSLRWKKNIKYDRETCVSDLLERKLLDDLSEAQVLGLLGTPDSKESSHWDYEIRPENASFETLFVTFKDGKVTKSELRSNP